MQNRTFITVPLYPVSGCSGTFIYLDIAPIALMALPNNTRITALKAPVVDEDTGIAASIRLLHSSKITREMLPQTGFATEEMLDFLIICMRYGVSVQSVGL